MVGLGKGKDNGILMVELQNLRLRLGSMTLNEQPGFPSCTMATTMNDSECATNARATNVFKFN